MNEQTEVPLTVITRLRAICLALPETHEEQAWVGTRWRIPIPDVRARTSDRRLLAAPLTHAPPRLTVHSA